MSFTLAQFSQEIGLRSFLYPFLSDSPCNHVLRPTFQIEAAFLFMYNKDMNFIDRIKMAEPSFTKSDRQIYQCIKADSWVVIRDTSSIVELAEKCGVSKSAILRFAKKLGYSGYSEFRYDFTIMEHSNISNDVHASKMDYILESYGTAIKTIKRHLSENDFVTIAKEVVKADSIRICGYNRSSFIASYFKYRLLKFNITSEVVTDTLLLQVLSDHSKQKELFFFFTVRANSTTPLNAYIKKCHENKKRVVLVTMNQNTPYKKFADHFVLLPDIRVPGLFIDEGALLHVFMEILLSYISEQIIINE